MSALAAGISAAGAAIAAGINAGASSSMNKKTIRANDRWRQQSRAWMMEDERRQNEYNAPSAQMKRMIEAGISPSTAAQGISGGGSISAGPGTYTGPNEPPTPDPNAAPDFSGVAPAAMQAITLRDSLKTSATNRAATAASAENTQADTALKEIQGTVMGIDTELKNLSLRAARDDYEADRKIKLQSLTNMKMNLLSAAYDNALKAAQARGVEYTRQFQEGSLRNSQESNRIANRRLDLESPYFGQQGSPLMRLWNKAEKAPSYDPLKFYGPQNGQTTWDFIFGREPKTLRDSLRDSRRVFPGRRSPR